MSEEDNHSFMLDYLTWMKGWTVKPESLHIYNFGYERSLPLPSIPLTPDSKLKFNLKISGMATPSKQSFAVIGEKYVDRFDEVMDRRILELFLSRYLFRQRRRSRPRMSPLT